MMKHLHLGRRARRICLVAGIVVIVLLLFGFFGLPPIVRSQAEKRLSAELDRPVTIEKVRINPLVLAATIEGFTIEDRDGEPFVSWRRFHANFDSFSVFTGDWRFSEIALEGLRARVTVAENGELNFADILERPSAPEETNDDEDPRPLFIRELVVTDAQLAFTDASRSEPFETQVGPLTFTLEDFRTAGGDAAPYAFKAQTEAGEALTWQGTISTEPLSSAGSFDLRNVALPKYAPYYRDFVEFDLRDGSLDLSGRYSFSLASGPPHLTWQDGAVSVRDLRIGLRDTQDPMVQLTTFDVQGIDLEIQDPASPTGTIARVAAQGLHVRALRDENGINLLRALPSAAPEAPTPQAAAPAPTSTEPRAASLPPVAIAEIDLSGARIEWEDHTLPSPAQAVIEALAVNVRELDLGDPTHRMPVLVTAKLASGGDIRVEGEASLLPLTAALATQVDDLALAAADPYVSSMAALRLTDGRLKVSGNAELDDGVARFSGDVAILQLHTEDAAGSPLSGWESLEITEATVTSRPLAVHAEQVRLVKPAAHVRIDAEGRLNVSQITKGDNATQAAETPAVPAEAAARQDPQDKEEAAPPDVALARFELVDGELHFHDQSVDPHVQMAFEAFGGTITGLSSKPGSRAQLDLRGQATGGASIRIAGQVNPLSRPPFADVTVDFQNLDLSPAGPYVAKYAGFRLNGGTLTLDVDADLADWRLNSRNVVTLEQFTLGERSNSPDATTLPVQLGLSLLRDRSGRIVLEIPIQGKIDDPSFSVGPVVGRVITNLLTKAATSPFSLLGAMFGGGGEELSFQVFQPGVADIAPDQLQKLETVARALRERPGLKLEVRGSFHPDIDREALQHQRLEQELRAAANKPADAGAPAAAPDPQRRLDVLAARYREAFPPAASAETSGSTPTAAATPPDERTAASDDDPSLRRRFTRWVRRVLGRSDNDQATSTVPEPVDTVAAAPSNTAQSATPADLEQPQPTPEQMFDQLAQRIPVSQDELQQLAQARAAWVRSYLVDTGGVEPARISLAPTSPEGPRVNLGLK